MGILKKSIAAKSRVFIMERAKLLLLESMAILASHKISNYKKVGQSILDSIFLDCLKINRFRLLISRNIYKTLL